MSLGCRVEGTTTYTMNPAKPCSICGEACKSVTACRSLRLPPDGFYTGGGGGGGHSHDDDCEEVLIARLFCVDEFLVNVHQPFLQTYSQDDGIPPMKPTQVWALHTIPNTPSNAPV